MDSSIDNQSTPTPPPLPIMAPPVVRTFTLQALPVTAWRDVNTDAAGRIVEDVACKSCGYNLRGLPLSGRCPECHTAVGRSVRGDLLQFCEPAWVDRLAAGMNWMIAGVFSAIGLAVLLIVVNIGLGVATVSTGGAASAVFGVWNFVQAGLNLAVSVISMIGYWLATTPDPATIDSEPAVSTRRAARWLLLASIVSGPFETMVQPLMTNSMLSSSGIGGLMIMLLVLTAALSIASLAGMTAMCIWMRRLVLRVPNRSVATQTTVVMWGTLSSLTVFLVVGLTAPFTGAMMIRGGGASASPLFLIISLSACAAAPILCVFAIWSIVLMFRYRAMFKAAAGQARASWAMLATG